MGTSTGGLRDPVAGRTRDQIIRSSENVGWMSTKQGWTQPEINFDTLREIDNNSEEELSLMLSGTTFPG